MKTKMNWKEELPTLRKYIEDDKMTYEEVGKIYGKPKNQIECVCIRYGVKYSHRKVFPWSESEIEIVRKGLLEEKTYKEISELLPGRTENAVRGLFEYHSKELNLIKPNPRRFGLSEEETKQIYNLILDGYNELQIKELMHVDLSWIRKVKVEYNITVPTRKDLADRGIFIEKTGTGYLTRKETCLTKEKLLELLNNGISLSEISRQYNVNFNTVRVFAQRLGWKDEKLERAKQLKYKILKETLGREPTKEEQKQSFCNIFTEDYLINLLRKTDYNFAACGDELGIDPKCISQAIKRLDMKIPDEVFRKTRSYGEKLISDVLSSLKIEYTSQFRLDNVIPNRIWVFIDFCLVVNGVTYWIEANGRQHYNSGNCFTRSDEDFIDQVKRDMYLKKLAENKGVVFLEIPYTYYSTKKIQDLLQRVIIGGEDINDIIDYTPFYKEINELGISIDEN